MSIRVGKNLTLKERKTYTFDGFKGVDFTTSPHKVASYRATQAQNLIYKNGTVRKRNGWESLCKLPSKINGLFSFELLGEKFVICYAGTEFYRLDWSENLKCYERVNITGSCTYDPAKINKEILIERRLQVYINDNKAYFVGAGDYLVFGRWQNGNYELRRVYNNEDTYIPTTTINIDEDSIEDENRGFLDNVNIFSPYRRNEFLGIDAPSGTWTVDTAFKKAIIKNDKGETEYIDNPLYSEQPINPDSYVSIVVYTYKEDGVTPISINIDNHFTGDERKNLFKANAISSDLPVGTIDFATGKITLNINTKPQEEDTSNIIVTFEKSVDEQESLIAGATISTVFGCGGASNRLFVSGNAKNKNFHAWSEMYDFTYFPDNNYDKIGSDSSAIVGYVRVSDGTLLAFKERNGSDSTVYYITGQDYDDIDFRGDPVYITKFFKKAGNVADTIFAKYATANLNGDNLILTRNGVKGLQLQENISIENYQIQERGRNIREKLLWHKNLNDACGFVFDDKYYLSVDGVTYIADSRFTFGNDEDINDSFNYEWWYWTNVDARVWCEIDNVLYFGTNNGLICKFHDKYADITFQNTEDSDLKIGTTESSDMVIYNQDLDSVLNENDEIIFANDSEVYALFIDKDEIRDIDDEGYLLVSEETIRKVYDGIKCYALDISGTGLELKTEYAVGIVDFDKLRFSIIQGDEQVYPFAVGFKLLKKVSGKPLYVTNVNKDEKEFQLKEFEGGDILNLERYDIETPLVATIKYKKDIRAEWYTPIFDFGTNIYSKTLFNVTVATEPLEKGSIVVGYQTRNIAKDFCARGARIFDFNDISFEDFSFESSFASSHTLRTKERNFNFIVVRYVSDNQHSCAVNSITIRYKINSINKGVR